MDLEASHRRPLRLRSSMAAFSPFFLQQEGMFWRSSLWQAVGGAYGAMRLAGDFDLWRRFAAARRSRYDGHPSGVFRSAKASSRPQSRNTTRKSTVSSVRRRWRGVVKWRKLSAQRPLRRLRATPVLCAVLPITLYSPKDGNLLNYRTGRCLYDRISWPQKRSSWLRSKSSWSHKRSSWLRSKRSWSHKRQLVEFKRSRWTKLGCLLRLTKLRVHLQE